MYLQVFSSMDVRLRNIIYKYDIFLSINYSGGTVIKMCNKGNIHDKRRIIPILLLKRLTIFKRNSYRENISMNIRFQSVNKP